MLADAALISEPFMLFCVIIVKDFLINIVRLLKIKKHLENGDFSCMLIIKNNCIEWKKHMYKFLITLLLQEIKEKIKKKKHFRIKNDKPHL